MDPPVTIGINANHWRLYGMDLVSDPERPSDESPLVKTQGNVSLKKIPIFLRACFSFMLTGDDSCHREKIKFLGS